MLVSVIGNETVFVKGPAQDTTVGVYAIRNPAANSLMVFVYNFQAVGNNSISNETVEVTIAGLGSKPNPVAYRIDSANSNAPAYALIFSERMHLTKLSLQSVESIWPAHIPHPDSN